MKKHRNIPEEASSHRMFVQLAGIRFGLQYSEIH